MSANNTRSPIELLKLSELFKGLRKADLVKISRYCEVQDYKADTVVVKEKPVSGRVYVIDSGDIVISRRENDQDSVLARFIGGESFGELDLFSDSGGAVTVRAETDSRLLMFPGDGQSVAGILRSSPAVGSHVVKNLLSMVAKRIRSTNNLLSQRSPWVQELRKLVFVDKLTGLYNRTWLNEGLEKELEGKRAGTSILIVKPDNFKVINDTYGHDAGDKALLLLADTVQQAAKNLGTAARHGGNVFAIVYKNSNARETEALARSILKKIRNINLEVEIGAADLVFTASLGIMRRKPGDETSIPDATQVAFDRMLIARNAGGDRISESSDE